MFSLPARDRTATSVRSSWLPIIRAPTPLSANDRRVSSSAGVHGLVANRPGSLISPSPSASPPHIAGPGLSLTSAFNVERQPLAELHAEKIDACRLKHAEVQKYIRTARVVLDESEAAIGIPHFQGSGSHSNFPVFQPEAGVSGKPQLPASEIFPTERENANLKFNKSMRRWGRGVE